MYSRFGSANAMVPNGRSHFSPVSLSCAVSGVANAASSREPRSVVDKRNMQDSLRGRVAALKVTRVAIPVKRETQS